jgi:Flp pilus assembly protein TadB
MTRTPVTLRTAGLAPKTLAATAIPLLAGVVLLVLDKLAGIEAVVVVLVIVILLIVLLRLV